MKFTYLLTKQNLSQWKDFKDRSLSLSRWSYDTLLWFYKVLFTNNVKENNIYEQILATTCRGLLKVTGNSTYWHSAYEFLLAFNSNYLLHHFWDTVRYWLKTADFNLSHQNCVPIGSDVIGILLRSLEL